MIESRKSIWTAERKMEETEVLRDGRGQDYSNGYNSYMCGKLYHSSQALIISASPQFVFLDGMARYCPVCAVQQVTRNMKMRVHGPACSSLGCW